MAIKLTPSLDAKINRLTRQVEKGFAAVAADLAQRPTTQEVREIVRHEIAELVPGIVALELKPIRQQLKEIEGRLATLEEHYANLKGVTKEIDDLRAEVRAIKKHLGLTTDIAA